MKQALLLLQKMFLSDHERRLVILRLCQLFILLLQRFHLGSHPIELLLAIVEALALLIQFLLGIFGTLLQLLLCLLPSVSHCLRIVPRLPRGFFFRFVGCIRLLEGVLRLLLLLPSLLHLMLRLFRGFCSFVLVLLSVSVFACSHLDIVRLGLAPPLRHAPLLLRPLDPRAGVVVIHLSFPFATVAILILHIVFVEKL